MVQVTPEDIKKVARLARIEVKEGEREILAKEVGMIIGWVDKLNEVDTSKVEPLTSVCNSSLRLAEDKISDGNIAEDILKNSNNSLYGYFSVPKVIE